MRKETAGWILVGSTVVSLASYFIVDDYLKTRDTEKPPAPKTTIAQVVTLRHLWRFGDGDSSIEANPSHVYMEPGTYDVELIVTDPTSGLSDTLLKPAYILVYPPGPYPVHPVRGHGVLRRFQAGRLQ